MTEFAARRSILHPTDVQPRRPIEWRWLLMAVGSLAVLYLSMLNRYWVPSGDGEVYTCIARSLTRGEGLKFNGFLAAIAPPGWPFVLSLAMRISPEFWFLKLVTTFSMLGAMAIAFLCVRRFVSDRAAAGIIFLTGTLSSLYPLTFWMHTEAFFCLLGFAMLLLAFRISEGVARVWEAPAMLLLLSAGALTRWPGVLHVVLLAPILYSGWRQPWRRVTTSALVIATFAVGIGTFIATKDALTLSKQEARYAANAGGAAESDGGEVVDPTAIAIPPTQPSDIGAPTDDAQTPETNTFKETKRGLVGELVYRVSIAGKWFAWLLWQPTRFGQSVSLINASALVTGWLTIGLLAIAMVSRLRRQRDFFWVGLAIYTGGLVVMWPNPNARYFVPVAPFIILGVFIGLRTLAGAGSAVTSSVGRRIAKPLGAVFVAALLVANLPLLVIDIGVFRSNDFYANYEAGSNADLIQAAAFIRTHSMGSAMPVVASERYENMGRQRYSKYGIRALHLLVDRPIVGSPRRSRLSARPTDDEMRKWLRNRVGVDQAGASYYVYQTNWFPWRVWHFRLPDWLQVRLVKMKPTTRPAMRPMRQSGGWELWARYNAGYRQVDLPAMDEAARHAAYPTRVPGL